MFKFYIQTLGNIIVGNGESCRKLTSVAVSAGDRYAAPSHFRNGIQTMSGAFTGPHAPRKDLRKVMLCIIRLDCPGRNIN